MVHEVTKEEAEYGYRITESPATKRLVDGNILNGKQVNSVYRGDEWSRHVLCHRVRDAGLLVMIQTNNIATAADKEMIELFWRSFRVTIR